MRRFRHLVLCAAVSACVHSSEVPCGDGRVCPPGNTCDLVNQRCLSPEQTAACTGLADGAACTIATADGTCVGGACEPHTCGDGVRTGTEACDGSDLGSADCTTAGFYEPGGLACSQFCTFDTSGCVGRCGDGIVNGDELCDGAPPSESCVDDGFDAGALACSAACAASFTGCARFGWQRESTGLASISAISVFNDRDLWATGPDGSGAGALAHFDGAQWSLLARRPAGLYLDVSAVGPAEVWAVGPTVGSDAGLLHLRGGSAVPMDGFPPFSPSAVRAFGPDDVLVATTDGGVWRWDGGSWAQLGSGAAPAAIALRGTAEADLWAILADGSVQRWTGTAWTATPVGMHVVDVASLGSDHAWAVGVTATFAGAVARWTGASWIVATPFGPNAGDNPSGVAVTEDNDVWVGLSAGNAAHFDGAHWVRETVTSTGVSVTAMAAASQQRLAAGADGGVYRYRGQAYAGTALRDAQTVTAAWGAAPDAVFAGDVAGRLYRADGQATVVVADSPAGAVAVSSITGTSASDVWASFTDGSVFHFDGSVWTRASFTVPNSARAFAGAPDRVWFASDNRVQLYDGTALVDSLSAAGPCFVAGRDPAHVWASCGTDLYAWDGTTWSAPVALPIIPPDAVAAIVAATTQDVFIVTQGAVGIHARGAAVTAELLPLVSDTPEWFAGGDALDDLFVASHTELVHYDGQTWSPVRRPDAVVAGQTIGALAVQPAAMTIAFGTAGQVRLSTLFRTRPWNCRAHETNCTDGVDDDCDGLVDGNDPDCP